MGLTLTGALLFFLAYFVLGSTPLSALGISTMIVGGVSLALGRGDPKISPEASAILFESGLENISAIVEELGLRSKAIYLPSSMTQGKPKALIPLHSNPHLPKVEKPLPKRLIVKYGPNPDDMGLLLTIPGYAVSGVVNLNPASASGDLEAALSLVLASATNLADGFTVTMGYETVLVEVSNPRLEYRNMWVYECIGSPMASMVASIAAVVLDKQVSIEREEFERGKQLVELRLAG